MNKKLVDLKLYDKEYFLKNLPGYEEYSHNKGKEILEHHQHTLYLANLKKGETVLDIGCGRGELVRQFALRKCKVVAIDASLEAIKLAKETISQLPVELQKNVRFECMKATDINFSEKFDAIFMTDILEHLYDWELKILLDKIKRMLTENGRLIIQTPNLNYECFLYPLKHLLTSPFIFLKQLFRIFRGKNRCKTPKEWFKNTFKIRYPRPDYVLKMHINIKTPWGLKNLLRGFDAKIWCSDHSKNPVSLVLRKWCGREMIAIVRNKKIA